jgi:hypothetical protein
VSPLRLPVSDEAERRQRIHGPFLSRRGGVRIATLPCLKPSLGERLIIGRSNRGRRSAVGMAMEFTRVIGPVADMEIWSGSSNGFSFVISYESRSGPGFHGRTGFVASWRPIHHQKTSAIKIGGSLFKTLAEAEEACKVMLSHLKR